MNIAITGHTSGIGRSLYNKFIDEEHAVAGFSSRIGYNIGMDTARQSILEQVITSNVFVNNAWHTTGQLAMLKEILNMWEGTDNYIINVSSNIRSLPESFFVLQEVKDYRDSKRDIDDLINSYSGTVKILNVFPDLTNTNFNLGIGGFDLTTGMDPDYVADLIYNEFNSNPNNKEFVIKHWQWLKHAN